jgi:hypothetical protein
MPMASIISLCRMFVATKREVSAALLLDSASGALTRRSVMKVSTTMTTAPASVTQASIGCRRTVTSMKIGAQGASSTAKYGMAGEKGPQVGQVGKQATAIAQFFDLEAVRQRQQLGAEAPVRCGRRAAP